ncbi:alkaline phosphatase family protein [Tenacibaculum pacificus]|uniref:alkaline phosphatase family protein n=1 Tax=Tenacibaculum pacificus TaxID=3018314 RepID=UPI002FDEB29D
MKKLVPIAILAIVCLSSFTTIKKKTPKKPKLVVGIVIDQMRYDYLTRFATKYGKDGFNRLLKSGFSLENAHYNYIPTYTAVGHASIYTGTTPVNHAIISNYWYDKFLKETIYCVDDSNYKTIGNDGKGGKKSPKRMLSTSITDQLRLAQNIERKNYWYRYKRSFGYFTCGSHSKCGLLV